MTSRVRPGPRGQGGDAAGHRARAGCRAPGAAPPGSSAGRFPDRASDLEREQRVAARPPAAIAQQRRPRIRAPRPRSSRAPQRRGAERARRTPDRYAAERRASAGGSGRGAGARTRREHPDALSSPRAGPRTRAPARSRASSHCTSSIATHDGRVGREARRAAYGRAPRPSLASGGRPSPSRAEQRGLERLALRRRQRGEPRRPRRRRAGRAGPRTPAASRAARRRRRGRGTCAPPPRRAQRASTGGLADTGLPFDQQSSRTLARAREEAWCTISSSSSRPTMAQSIPGASLFPA